jgi:hypothetical protein
VERGRRARIVAASIMQLYGRGGSIIVVVVVLVHVRASSLDESELIRTKLRDFQLFGCL